MIICNLRKVGNARSKNIDSENCFIFKIFYICLIPRMYTCDVTQSRVYIYISQRLRRGKLIGLNPRFDGLQGNRLLNSQLNFVKIWISAMQLPKRPVYLGRAPISRTLPSHLENACVRARNHYRTRSDFSSDIGFASSQ